MACCPGCRVEVLDPGVLHKLQTRPAAVSGAVHVCLRAALDRLPVLRQQPLAAFRNDGGGSCECMGSAQVRVARAEGN